MYIHMVRVGMLSYMYIRLGMYVCCVVCTFGWVCTYAVWYVHLAGYVQYTVWYVHLAGYVQYTVWYVHLAGYVQYTV